MRYNGPAKEVRKRWGTGKPSDPNDAARDAQPERNASRAGDAQDWNEDVPDWNEDVQDQISALLGEDAEETEDDDALDLAAIRQALADKEASLKADQPADDTDDDLYLVIDEILSPETPQTPTFEDEAPEPQPPQAQTPQAEAPAEEPAGTPAA